MTDDVDTPRHRVGLMVMCQVLADSMVTPPVVMEAVAMFEKSKPSGKDRAAIKTARKQSRKTRRKKN